MKRIFVMRHATPHNPQGVVYGDLPGFPLSDKGKRQAKEAGEFLSNIKLDLVVTSPLERTSETAHVVTDLNDGDPKIIVENDLKDINFGVYQGKLKVSDKEKDRERYWKEQLEETNGFESPLKIKDRVIDLFKSIIDSHPDDSVLFVSHAGPMAFLFQTLKGNELKPDAISHFPYGITQASIWEIILEPKIKITKLFEPTIK